MIETLKSNSILSCILLPIRFKYKFQSGFAKENLSIYQKNLSRNTLTTTIFFLYKLNIKKLFYIVLKVLYCQSGKEN